MDGVLVVDKPAGLTSHDVVAVARRALGQPRIGHTGTLDPLATGVLPLALGHATRLVRFLAASDKDYDATIRFGLTTDTYDITGTPTASTGRVPSPDDVTHALERLRGEYLQTPPPFSAKKIGGQRAYALARRDAAVTLTPVQVSVARADLEEMTGARVRVTLTCSAGFYVRSFAHALGEMVGTGACLEALRRLRSGRFGIDAAVPLDALRDPDRVAATLVPLNALLPELPAVEVAGPGRAAVSHGRDLMPGDYRPTPPALPALLAPPAPDWVRILDASGDLVALATEGRTPGSLHPAVVLI